MLSIMDSTVLYCITALAFLSAFVPTFVAPILACFSTPSKEEEEIREDIIKLNAELRNYPMKEHFATHSRIARKINVLDADYKNKVQVRKAKTAMYKFFVTKGLEISLGILAIGISLWHRREPVVIFHQDLFPFNGFLSYPCEERNAISPHAWLVISRMSMGIVKRTIAN